MFGVRARKRTRHDTVVLHTCALARPRHALNMCNVDGTARADLNDWISSPHIDSYSTNIAGGSGFGGCSGGDLSSCLFSNCYTACLHEKPNTHDTNTHTNGPDLNPTEWFFIGVLTRFGLVEKKRQRNHMHFVTFGVVSDRSLSMSQNVSFLSQNISTWFRVKMKKNKNVHKTAIKRYMILMRHSILYSLISSFLSLVLLSTYVSSILASISVVCSILWYSWRPSSQTTSKKVDQSHRKTGQTV